MTTSTPHLVCLYYIYKKFYTYKRRTKKMWNRLTDSLTTPCPTGICRADFADDGTFHTPIRLHFRPFFDYKISFN